MEVILVGLGGALGAISRYLVGNVIGKFLGSTLPYGTFIINIIGCFCMGLLMTVIMERQMLPPMWRLFLCVGFLGGFTTFSSFGHETFSLINAGRVLEAMGYVGGSVLVGLIAATMGVFTARAL